ncbi:MAG: PKD domain-containing protein [Thermoplasmata archaeon]|nr:MAG: PKD domain-containing protein [Thermoplasmata archaeon]
MKSKIASTILCMAMITTAFSIATSVSAYPAGWGEDTRLTYASDESRWPEVVIDSADIIYVVWQDYRDGSYNLYLKKSSDFGKTWSSDIKVTDTTWQSVWPQIALDSNDVLHLLWLEEDETSTKYKWQPYDSDYKEILYKNSADGGTTWGSEVQITSNTGRMQRIGLDIAVGQDDMLHVAYSKYSPSQIYHRKSTDGGVTWNAAKVIGDDRDAARPVVIAADTIGHVYVAFHAWGTVGDLHYVKSNDNGDTWGSEINLIGGSGWANFAYLSAADDGHVFLTYTDNLGVGTDHWNDPGEVYIRISDDYAQNWGSRIRLTHDNYAVQEPSTALDSDNNAHIVWYDIRDGNWEIYYTKTDSSGNTLIDDTRLTDDPATSVTPVIALDSLGTRHVIWSDSRVSADNYELFYKLDAQPPVADADGPYLGYEGSPVTFNASASYDPDGDTLQYRWDFDSDGNWDTGWSLSPYAEHTWGDDYFGEVVLEVFDGEYTDNDTTNVTINNVAPTVFVSANQTINEGDIVYLRGTFTDPGFNDTHTIEWDFGDGETATGTLNTSHTYGDDGEFTVTLTVTDDDGGVGSSTLIVTVNNVDPNATIESVLMDVQIGLRVAGRKFNDVGMTLYEEGSSLGYISIERLPGSPDAQMVWIPITLDMTKSYSAIITFIPEDPPNVGANPVWIYIKSENGSIKKIHHTFNVQQSKKRDSDHWNHIDPWEVDLNVHLIGSSFEVTSHITDPGSDDEILTYTYGSQVVNVTYLNNPPNPDPYPSPEINPRDIYDTTKLTYEGPGTLSLVVIDDDGGTTTPVIELK